MKNMRGIRLSTPLRALAVSTAVPIAIASCSSARDTPPVATPAPTTTARPVSMADVHFMSAMIPHHAQAVKMARWAPSHGASPSMRILAERIVVSQQDEIELMRSWLRDHGQHVPEPDATHIVMHGMQHDTLMPGMLTEAELAQLDRARGQEFDRLFLRFMIRHHEGAITMIDQLFKSPGAAQDNTVFKMASDMFADQTTEIERMQKMLDAMQ